MVAQSIASRPRRPQQPEPDDVVVARALQFAAWARRNIVLISVVGGLAVLILGGLFWYQADQQRREEQAAIAFLPVEQAVLAGDETIAARELQLFIQRHDGTVYADEARVLLAGVHLRAGRPEEAITAAAPVADDLDHPLGPQAALLTGAAQEAAEQPDEAIATYLRVAEDAPVEFRRVEALEDAARLHVQQGDYAAAADLYRQLIEMHEDSQERTIYEMRLAEAEAQAATP